MAASLCATLVAIGVGLLPGASAARPEVLWRRDLTNRGDQKRLGGEAVPPAEDGAPSGSHSEEGRGEFSQDCEPFPGQRVVLVTVNDEYLEMFRNWLVHARPFIQATEHLHVIAEEEEVVPKLMALRKKHDLDFSVATPSKLGLALVEDPFGSDGFGTLVRKRPDYILNVLEKGCSVLFIDLDTVLLKDPFKDMHDAGSSDLYVTSNDPRLEGNRTEYCSCFLYVHPTEWTQKLMDDWAVATQGKNKNQGPLNDKLRERGVQGGHSDKVVVLPMGQYPPGGVVNGHLGDKYKPDPNPVMYHANWLTGIVQKMQFLKKHNAWKPESLEE